MKVYGHTLPQAVTIAHERADRTGIKHRVKVCGCDLRVVPHFTVAPVDGMPGSHRMTGHESAAPLSAVEAAIRKWVPASEALVEKVMAELAAALAIETDPR